MRLQTALPKLIFTWLFLFGTASAGADDIASVSVTHDSKLAFFDTMAEVLPGNWEGQFADGSFDNPTSEWRPARINYHLTAGGTAIVEDYFGQDESVVGMTTVYHQDNNDIRATHFCGAMNHPRMISREFDAESKTMSFGFVDVSNLKSPEDYHSRDIDLTIVDDDNIRLTFFGLTDGKRNSRVFAFSRKKEQG